MTALFVRCPSKKTWQVKLRSENSFLILIAKAYGFEKLCRQGEIYNFDQHRTFPASLAIQQLIAFSLWPSEVIWYSSRGVPSQSISHIILLDLISMVEAGSRMGVTVSDARPHGHLKSSARSHDRGEAIPYSKLNGHVPCLVIHKKEMTQIGYYYYFGNQSHIISRHSGNLTKIEQY